MADKLPDNSAWKYVRDHTCVRCRHAWTADVVLSEFSHNLSGERNEYCPKCGTREVFSTPAYLQPLPPKENA